MAALLFVISFVLAFLLFSVQPMASKMVLPILGGTPAVWNTAMFTFQCLLLGGYVYAHLLATNVGLRWQLRVHVVLVAFSCLVLPLTVRLASSDAMLADPIAYLIAAFVIQMGLPFLALAATQPLLQSWLARSGHPMAQTPYILYSASNLGSFAGLIGYILLVEPQLDLAQQSVGWSFLYLAGMALLVLAAHRLKATPAPVVETVEAPAVQGNARAGWARCLGWVFLAFLPSSLSLGVTTYITTDIASVPLLWVLPLSIYLLSFVDAFRTRPILVRVAQYTAPLMGVAALVTYALQSHRFTYGYPVHLLAFALLAFALHGWLARSKPEASHLTRFYLCLSLGGALGGTLNGLVAPLVFYDALEYPFVLLIASLASFMLLQQGGGAGWLVRQVLLAARMFALVVGITVVIYLAMSMVESSVTQGLRDVHSGNLAMAACVAGAIGLLLQRKIARAYYVGIGAASLVLFVVVLGDAGQHILFKGRNFFGVMRVIEHPDSGMRYLMHGTTLHGMQPAERSEATTPYSYYWMLSDVFDQLPITRSKPVGAVGLGIGTIKCTLKKGQQIDFFEIDAMAQQLAENTDFFQQLSDCPGSYRILIGDGRLKLDEQPDGTYGLIVLDAFSSDAIPAHLLTREAMAIYLAKLAPHGVLLLHTTNRHLDLWPLIGAHAEDMGFVAYGRYFSKDGRQWKNSNSNWVLVAREEGDIAPAVQEEGWQRIRSEGDTPWTDTYINLLPYWKWLRR